RETKEKLDLAILGKQAYQPGDRVRLVLEAKTENRELAPAVLLVSVVDMSVFKLAGDKTARVMPTHFLLTSEVQQPEDLENADFFLGNHPKSRQALDLLLGVQGWRRCAEQEPEKFQKQNEDAAHLLQAAAPGARKTSNPNREILAKVDAGFAPKFVELQTKIAEK